MLALSRGEGQSIIINGTIEVKIVKWTRSSVRLAIEAPRDVTIDRDEVWRKMHPDKPTPLDQVQALRENIGSTESPSAPTGEDTDKPRSREAV
ncbi:MAG: carbon storage regulator [Phycisphaerae bacterium]